MIICIVGPSCAGKTTSSQYLSSNYEMEYIEASDYVQEEYLASSPPDSIMEFVTDTFSTEGKDYFARKMVSEIKNKSSKNPLIIAGFRTVEEYHLIERRFSNVFCIGVYADSSTRYQRHLQREDTAALESYTQFLNKDFKEFRFGILDLLNNYCERLIINEGSFSSLYKNLDEEIVETYVSW